MQLQYYCFGFKTESFLLTAALTTASYCSSRKPLALELLLLLIHTAILATAPY
uniref:Uncharacterized protein n=1 Tax=Anguilla anguilla TaxID=7936 RepID=A0A0E9V1M1_ANGAN